MTETNVILILPNDENTLRFQNRTETMWINDGEVQDLYFNKWNSDFLHRKATKEEVSIFKDARSKLGDLKTYGELIFTN